MIKEVPQMKSKSLLPRCLGLRQVDKKAISTIIVTPDAKHEETLIQLQTIVPTIQSHSQIALIYYLAWDLEVNFKCFMDMNVKT